MNLTTIGERLLFMSLGGIAANSLSVSTSALFAAAITGAVIALIPIFTE